MLTDLECLVCFMRQALATAQMATDDPAVQRQVVEEVGRFLARVDFGRSPPENAVDLYALIARVTGVDDPFARVKEQENRFALDLADQVEEAIGKASDPLETAIRFAIGGNIIDHAAQQSFDAAATLATCQESDFVVDDIPRLRRDLETAQDLLYLADNCGEIVFDRFLVQELHRRGCRVTVAVRGSHIVNDATLADAELAGLGSECRLIDNGTGCPGTPLAACSPEFRECFTSADLIISKGMGNFETLSEVRAPLYFLLTVKCSVVARLIVHRRRLPSGAVQGRGEMVVMQQEFRG